MSTENLANAHQWTHDGKEVLIVKCVANDGSSYGGFKWPLTVGASVEPTSWNPHPSCGEGLHGWPWGLSIGDGKEPDWKGTWLVFSANPEDVVSLGGKCKARAGTIRFVGPWWEATNFVLAGQMALVQKSARGSASSTGASGSASSTGERGSASSTGWRGSASSTGERGSASSTGASGSASSTGWSGSASSTGWSGSASSTGWRGSASSTGGCSAAVVTGADGKARCGVHGVIALAFYNAKHDRLEMRSALVGDGKDKNLKPNVWYRLNKTGRFIIDREAQAAEKKRAA